MTSLTAVQWCRDGSLERSAVLLGYIADRLGNIESFPFERKVPEEFIAQLNEYFG